MNKELYIKLSIFIFGILPATAWFVLELYLLYMFFDHAVGIGKLILIVILITSFLGVVGIWSSIFYRLPSKRAVKIITIFIVFGIVSLILAYIIAASFRGISSYWLTELAVIIPVAFGVLSIKRLLA